MFIFNINFTLTQFSPFPHFCCNILASSWLYFYKPHGMIFMLISIKFYSDPASLFLFSIFVSKRTNRYKRGRLRNEDIHSVFCTLRIQRRSQISQCIQRLQKQHLAASITFQRNTNNIIESLIPFWGYTALCFGGQGPYTVDPPQPTTF